MAAAYERLRSDACDVYVGSGWGSVEDFDAEIPALVAEAVPRERIIYGRDIHGQESYRAAQAGRRARVLLEQLAAWAEGHQEAFEIEERFAADAAARAAEENRRRPGFGT